MIVNRKGVIGAIYNNTGKLRYLDFALGAGFVIAGLMLDSTLMLAFGGLSLILGIINPIPKFTSWLEGRVIKKSNNSV